MRGAGSPAFGDEAGFLKQGKASCGVERQYTGLAGKVTNCQIGVFGARDLVKCYAFVGRALYLPKSWITDPTRLAPAPVPEGMAFATMPALAVEMIGRSIAAKMPFAWVAADAVYGVGDIEQAPRRAGEGYVLGMKGDPRFGSRGDKPAIAGAAEKIASDLDQDETRSWHGWHRHVSLVMLAFAKLAAIRAPPKKIPIRLRA
jgi:SRSO17 transposase